MSPTSPAPSKIRVPFVVQRLRRKATVSLRNLKDLWSWWFAVGIVHILQSVTDSAAF